MGEEVMLPELIKSLRILLVDDDSFMLELMQEMLRNLGLSEIAIASDGKQALALIDTAEYPIQLLICDLNMPEMDGIEFFRHLATRHFEGWMIVSSGSDTRLLKTVENLLYAHHLRFIDVLHKPIQQTHLVSALMKTAQPGKNHVMEMLSVEEIKAGIKNDQFEIFLQPQIDLASKRVVGAECLARLRHPTKGLVLPEAFILVAEEHGLIDALTIVIFSKAMRHLGEWTKQGHQLKISVNVSMDNLTRLDIPEEFAEITRLSGANINNVMLEITESRLMSNLAASLEVITRLSLMGFGLSVDDFGTGYASMEKLNQLPFTELKVDRAFVFGASDNVAAHAILDLSVKMGKSLGMRIVAEGAETQDDWDLVAAAGCDEVQGYFIAKPMPVAEFIAWKTEWNANLDQV